MFIKINFLVISIVVLTIFVKMVPAPEDPGRITSKDFNEFKDLYKTEIKEFRNKQENILKMSSLQNYEMPADDTSAYALLYFKYSFYEFNQFNQIYYLRGGSNVYINFLIWRKKKENEKYSDKLFSAEELARLKDLTKKELTLIYQCATLSSLPNKIENKYIFEELRFIYDMKNANEISMGGDQLSVNDVIKYIENIHREWDNEPLDELQRFNNQWDLYNFNDSIFTEYNSMSNEDICTDGEINYMDNGETKTMKVFDAFLHYFKESLDTNYYIAIHVNLNELEETDQKLYYNQMLKLMKNIYDAYCIYYGLPTIETGTAFVQQMVDVAEKIKQKSNITKELAEVVKQIQENSNNTKKDNGFEILSSRYIKCYDEGECDLPDRVYFKNIFQYLIFQIA